MITNISLVTVFCLDQDKARDFYVDMLGFEARADVRMGEDYRWVTLCHPSQPELEVTLMLPGPPLSPDAADFYRRQLEKGENTTSPSARPTQVFARLDGSSDPWVQSWKMM